MAVLANTYPNPQVAGIQGRPVDGALPVAGDVLKWDGAKWAPAPATAQANPTNAVPVQAFMSVWNGTTWDRLLSEGISADADNAPSAGTVSAEAYTMGFNGTTWDRIRLGGDNTTNPTLGKQAVLPGTVSTAAPSWTNGNIAPLSITPSGDARAIAKITDGTNTAAVKAASTAAVAADPALVVSISPNTNTVKLSDGASTAAIATGTAGPAAAALIVTPNTQQTFVVSAQGIATGNGKSMLSIENAGGSGKVLRVDWIKITNVTNSAVSGVNVQFDAFKITSATGGTTLTGVAYDSANSLSGGVTLRTNGTVSGEAATPLDTWFLNGDDIATGASTTSSDGSLTGHVLPTYGLAGTQRITIRPGEGFHVKCQTNTTVSSFTVLVRFTQE